MSKTKIFVSTAESRTGESIVANLLRSDFKSTLDVHCTIPSHIAFPHLEELGATVHLCDLDRCSRNEVKALLDDVDVMILVAPAIKEKVDVAKKLIEVAQENNLRNCIVISTQGCEESDKPEKAKFKVIEDFAKSQLKDSNVCIIRSGNYMQNLFLYAKQMKETGFLGLPTDKGKFASVDALDVGHATAMLCEEPSKIVKFKNQTFTLTGGESMNGEQIVELFKKCGLTVHFKNISTKEAVRYLKGLATVDESEINFLLEDFDLVKEGKMDYVTDDFKKLCDKEPRSLEDFLKDGIDAFKSV